MSMLGKRSEYVKTLFPMIMLVLITTLFMQRASGASEISVPLYKSPKIDGVISREEYPILQLDQTWGDLYAVHDGKRLVLGIVLARDCEKVDLLFNTGFLGATTLTTSALRYSIDISGNMKYYYGVVDKWVASRTSGVSFAVGVEEARWIVEISISLSNLNVPSNSEEKLGFAIIVYRGGLNYSWPQRVSIYNPSTWGIISSLDNWATKKDICLDVFLDKETLIVGSNLTITAIIRNIGDVPIPDYQISIFFDNKLIERTKASTIKLKTPLEKTDSVTYSKIITNITEGSHRVKVNVTGIGIYYDSDEKNNVGEKSIVARYAKIEVSGIPGIIVELDGESQVITEEEPAVLYSATGRKKIKVPSIYSPSEGLRYVFSRLRYDGHSYDSPELIINIDKDIVITLEYRKEYLVTLNFLDYDENPLTPSFFTCIFPNGTSYNGTSRRLWLPNGTLSLLSVNYAGMNVIEEARTYSIYGAREINIICKVLGGAVKIVDPFSIPMEGVEVRALFLNNTLKNYETGPDGKVNMSGVVDGRVKLTIGYMGYSTTVDIDFSKEREITIRIPISLRVVIIIVAAVSIVIVIVVFKLFLQKLVPKRRGEQPHAREEEYEFEEL
ncbi:MAG: CARDB domain-containing protein [Thermoproteota archaeon]